MDSKLFSKRDKIFPFEGDLTNEETFYLPPKKGSSERPQPPSVELYSYLRPLAFIVAILGMFPLKKFHSSKGPGNFRYCSLQYSYCLLATVGFLSAYATVYKELLAKTMEISTNRTDLLISSLFMIISPTTSCIAILLHLFSMKSLESVYAAMSEANFLLGRPSKEAGRRISYIMWLFVLYFSLISILYVMELYPQLPKDNFLRALGSMTVVVSLGLITLPVLHAAALFLCSAALFDQLNCQLRAVLDIPICSESLAFGQGEVRNLDWLRDVEKKIEQYRNTHRRILAFSNSVNEYFSFKILTSTSTISLLACYNFYTFWISLESNKWNFLVGKLCTAGTPLITIGILGWAVDTEHAKYQQTSEVIFDSRLSKADKKPSSLITFASQLLHFQPSFKVAGFFTMNRGLVLSITANLVSYLVVLIQFHKTDNDVST